MVIKNDKYELYLGDCLEVMDMLIGQGVKVDSIITDPPYGTTNRNKWDVILPFDDMWEKLKKLSNKTTPILLFSDEPFTSQLICSNLKHFKQRITWDKDRGSGFLNAKKMMLKQTEDICLFYEKPPTYNPIMKDAIPDRIRPNSASGENKSLNYGVVVEIKHDDKYDNTKRYPTNLLKFSSMTKDCNNLNRLHPTQKPVELLEYLIKTYTNEGDVVLDFTAGSFSTGVACINTNRKFIGIELDENYFNIGKERMKKTMEDLWKTEILKSF